MLATDTNTTLPLLAAALRRLQDEPIGGYSADGEAASEPIAWTTTALARSGQIEAALKGAEWLAEHQSRDGAVGVTQSQADPYWPTALAMIAWRAVDTDHFAKNLQAAADWALAQSPWTTEPNKYFGHDASLEGWSWAPETHSWLEPTAFFAIALRHDYRDHPRRRQAVRLLVDRLLADGGANYGNTTVLGQQLLQHVHSSGVVAWALAGEDALDERYGRTLDYLQESLKYRTGLASLAWSARGLAAGGRGQVAAEALAREWPRYERSSGLHKLALFANAALEIQQAEAAA